jgi:L-amino acid N-acyltransferase YncA
MDLLVRSVQPEDAEGIVGVLNPIILDGRFTVFDTPLTVQAEAEYISGFPQRGVFMVAVRQPCGTIVGFQSMEPFADYTHAFDHVGVLGTYVDLSLRRQGIATRLFEATFAEARQKGYEKIFTFVRSDNPAALQTYLSQGFRIVGTAQQQAKLKGRYIDEVIIEKILERGDLTGSTG